MAIDTSAVQVYTDAELLVLARNALAAIMTGKSYSIGGRSLTREDAAEIRETIAWLESRIETTANASGGNIALAQFGSRV